MEYANGNIRLIHGDCMDFMRTLPDNAFDLAVVDPPYGDGNFQTPPHKRAMSRDGGGWFDRYKRAEPTTGTHGEVREIQAAQLPPPEGQDAASQKKGIWWDVAPSEEYFKELFRVSKNQIIWGGNYFNLPPCRCFLVWRKLSISEAFSMAMCEYAWTSFNANAKWFECAPQGKKGDPRFHPTQKPIALYAWILNNYAKQGDTILDTHLGSGSSAIAAWELGFEFTGIEIDEEYYNNAVKRFKTHTAQQKLF